MPQLSDSTTQDLYCGYLFDIYKHFKEFSVAQKKLQFEGAIKVVFQQCAIPAPRIGWGDDGGFFRFSDWYLELDNKAVTMDPFAGPIRAWLYYSTMPYHESRHCEQFWIMAMGMLSGGVSIPAGPRGRSAFHAPTVQDRGEALVQMGFPQMIVIRAAQAKSSFSQQAIPLTRSWVDSIFGSGGRARRQTLTHLSKGGKHFAPYINLPEEADAWAVERSTSRTFRTKVQDWGSDDAVEGIAKLFA